MGRSLLTVLVVLLVAPDLATAQGTRAEAIQQEQADRQRILTPPRPTVVERAIEQLEQWGFISGQPRGVYPWLGSVYPGGGFAAGAGVRKEFGDDGAVNVIAGYSIKRFARGQADVALPTFAKNRAQVTLSGQYIDAPDVKYLRRWQRLEQGRPHFFGYTPTGGGARLDFDVSKYFTARRRGLVSRRRARRRAGPRPRSMPQFGPADTPGSSRRTSASSTAPRARRSTGGGASAIRALAASTASSSTTTATAITTLFVPFRGGGSAAVDSHPARELGHRAARRRDHHRHRCGNVVPYFLMPSLGGGASLRGYPDFRFGIAIAGHERRAALDARRGSWTWRSSTTPARSTRAGRISTSTT